VPVCDVNLKHHVNILACSSSVQIPTPSVSNYPTTSKTLFSRYLHLCVPRFIEE